MPAAEALATVRSALAAGADCGFWFDELTGPHAELAAICDTNADQLARAKALYPDIKLYGTDEEIINDKEKARQLGKQAELIRDRVNKMTISEEWIKIIKNCRGNKDGV